MEVYEFEKSLLTRLKESRSVLQCKDTPVPASEVRAEWAYHIELQIEPAGWNALWNISRVICAELKIKHPTIVFVNVEQVFFRDLMAVVRIISVQDEDIDIGELHDVPLVELWPTMQQENTSLNTDKTADCIDQLRFFYNHLWMPWDDDADDNCDWAKKHLDSRIRFCYDLRRKAMKRSVAAHVRNLLIEARYIQKRREYLEIEVSDDEDDETNMSKDVAELTRLHLRLAKIRPEIELLENPKMRKLMELAEVEENSSGDKNPRIGISVVMLKTNLGQQIEFLERVKGCIGSDKDVQTSKSLQEALDHSEPSDEIYIPPGKHSIEFLEYLNENGKVEALAAGTTSNASDSDMLSAKSNSVICTRDDESILLVFDGDFTVRNVTLDCRNVRTGILIRSGLVTFDNCIFIGNAESSTQQGLVVLGDANVVLNKCTLKYFATALSVFDESTVNLNETIITSAKTGIDMSCDARLHVNDARIVDCLNYGLALDTFNMDSKDRKLVCKGIAELVDVNVQHVVGDKCVFEGNNKGNILVVNKRKDLFKFDRLMDDLDNIYGKTAKLDDSADIPIDDSSIQFLEDDDDDYETDEGCDDTPSVIVID